MMKPHGNGLNPCAGPEGPYCPKCGSFNVQSGIKHKTMTHRCRDCTNESGKNKTMFTVRQGSVMEATRIPYRAWAVGIYLFSANIKGISSMQLRRELKIGQKAAWFMLQRLRLAFDEGPSQFSGPVETDSTFFGGKRKAMSNQKRKELAGTGRGGVGKAIVTGVKDRDTNKVAARVVESEDGPTLKGFVRDHVKPGTTLYTDEAGAYKGMPEFSRSITR